MDPVDHYLKGFIKQASLKNENLKSVFFLLNLIKVKLVINCYSWNKFVVYKSLKIKIKIQLDFDLKNNFNTNLGSNVNKNCSYIFTSLKSAVILQYSYRKVW